MLLETNYGASSPKVLLIVPHGSSGRSFFKHFAQIKTHPKVAPKLQVFERFVAIEQDQGSSELAHETARILDSVWHCPAKVLELDYPRAILDGGRQLSHCVRGFLPKDLISELEATWLGIHEKSLAAIRQQLHEINHAGGMFIDMHTMAPWTPKPFEAGPCIEETFENMEQYVDAFCHTSNRGYRRKLDLIIADQNGQVIGNKNLTHHLQLGFHDYPVDLSIPFCAPDHFMMNEYMKSCPGIAIDVPKDFLTLAQHSKPFTTSQGVDFCLENFHLETSQITKISTTIAAAIHACLTSHS